MSAAAPSFRNAPCQDTDEQALYTLRQLHSELTGKLSVNQRETERLRLAIFQVEAVMKLLSPDVNLRLIETFEGYLSFRISHAEALSEAQGLCRFAEEEV